MPALEAAGLSSRFDAVVTADDVYRGKPDPEGFLYAAQVRLLVEWMCLVCGLQGQGMFWWVTAGWLEWGLPGLRTAAGCSTQQQVELPAGLPPCPAAEDAATPDAVRGHWQLKPLHRGGARGGWADAAGAAFC